MNQPHYQESLTYCHCVDGIIVKVDYSLSCWGPPGEEPPGVAGTQSENH